MKIKVGGKLYGTVGFTSRTMRGIDLSEAEADVVARLGGDESAILQAGPVDYERAAALAARVVEAFAVPIDFGGIVHDAGASVGVALLPEHANAARGLVEAADTALRAKRAGRRRVSHFTNGGEREGLATA